MKKSILLATCLFIINPSFASISSCTDLYVGKVQSKKGVGLERFTLVESPTSSSGSNWIYLTGWEKEDKKTVLSTLLSAKMASKKLSIETGSGCSIASVQELSSIILQAGQ
jgi:hypothetical protein